MSLTGYSPWGHQESAMTEWTSTHKNIMWTVVCVQRMKTITAIIIIFVQNRTPINFSNAPLKAQDMLVHLLLMLMHRLRNWQKHATLIPSQSHDSERKSQVSKSLAMWFAHWDPVCLLCDDDLEGTASELWDCSIYSMASVKLPDRVSTSVFVPSRRVPLLTRTIHVSPGLTCGSRTIHAQQRAEESRGKITLWGEANISQEQTLRIFIAHFLGLPASLGLTLYC